MSSGSTTRIATRKQQKDAQNQVKSSKSQQTSKTTYLGLRTRSKNHLNTPSPGMKVMQTFKIFNDENSNPGSENNENFKNERTTSNETRLSVSTCQTDPASLPENKVPVSTKDFGVQVDMDLLCDTKDLDYYKKLADSRLRDIEKITDDLNSSNLKLEEMTETNENLVADNEKLVKKCEEYEEQLEFLCGQIEEQNLNENEDKNE